ALIIRNLATFPEQFDRFMAARESAGLISHQKFKRVLVGCNGDAGEGLVLRRNFQRIAQALGRGKVEGRVTPLDLLDRLEVMGLELDNQFFVEILCAACNPEGAIVPMATGATG